MQGPPLAPIIVVGCLKGGIGRTAVAANLAAVLALSGRRTLLIDLDPKGDATASVGLQRATGRKYPAALRDPWTLLREVQPAPRPAGLDVWTGGPGLEPLRLELAQGGGAPPDLLDRGLSAARQQYRIIVIDAPSDLGPLACNAYGCCDVLLLPISDTAFVARALEETVSAACRLNVHRPPAVLGLRLAVRDEDLAPESELASSAPGVELLEASICADAATINRAAALGLPVFEHAPGSRAARSFVELGREIVDRVLARSPQERQRAH